MLKPILSVIAVAALASCASAVEPAGIEPVGEVSSALAIDRTCSLQGCGANAATVGDGIIFDEVDGSGLFADASGLMLLNAQAFDHRPVNITVIGDQLSATAIDDPTDTYQDQQLRNMVLNFAHTDGSEYQIRINLVGITTYWTVRPGDIPIYQLFVWKTKKATAGLYQGPIPELEPEPLAGPGRPICTGKNFDTDAENHALEYGALMFEGDHFDDDKKTVTPPLLPPAPSPLRSGLPPGPRWFNLACIGTSMAKMHFLRHTKAGSFMDGGALVTTTYDQRTTMLKMLTADYCGDGHSFTVNGRPLAYQDPFGWYTMYPIDLSQQGLDIFEAVWGPHGAICLHDPRLAPLTEIRDYCLKVNGNKTPDCSQKQELTWSANERVASSNAVVKAP